MKKLNRERVSSDATSGNAFNVQERDTAASQRKATCRSWGEQWDNPNKTSPASSLAKSSTRSLQKPSQAGWGQRDGQEPGKEGA